MNNDVQRVPAEWPPTWAGGWGVDHQGAFVDIVVKALSMRLRWIPPGNFLMGSKDEIGRFEDEGPQHLVTLTRGFWLGETPCTQAHWEAVMGENPSRLKGADRPVESVSWTEVGEFCARLNGLLPGLAASLPTEAQWEYACRAGTTSAFNDGSACTNPDGKDEALKRLGWHAEGEKGETHPVGQLSQNAWGLRDMHGNVWEWCFDGMRQYEAIPRTDPIGPTEGAGRVVRGGSFWDDARWCRSAYRVVLGPVGRGRGLGFRLAAGQQGQAGEAERRDDGRGGRSPAAGRGPRRSARSQKPA